VTWLLFNEVEPQTSGENIGMNHKDAARRSRNRMEMDLTQRTQSAVALSLCDLCG
jgi:hypothetical protein